MQVLGVGVPGMGFKPFVPQGEAQGFEFPPSCGSAPGVGFRVQLCLSPSYLHPSGFFVSFA